MADFSVLSGPQVLGPGTKLCRRDSFWPDLSVNLVSGLIWLTASSAGDSGIKLVCLEVHCHHLSTSIRRSATAVSDGVAIPTLLPLPDITKDDII
jgi:hypothetical protein